MNASPGVSVVIPAYESQDTIAATLESLRRQTFRNFEIIVVDSSPGDAVERLVPPQFPEVRFVRSPTRMRPDVARNEGVRHARAPLLVFTDPDVVADADWLEQLVDAHERWGGPLIGAVTCLNEGWLEIGIHLAKFDLWLPGGSPRKVPVGPTVNFLCSREDFDRVGGLTANEMLGDTLFSWDLIEAGRTLTFLPAARVAHDHRQSFAAFVRERFQRGGDFARLRMRRHGWTAGRRCVELGATVLPVRFLKLLGRGARCACRSRQMGDFLRTLPIVAAGQAAWLAGEARTYARAGRRLQTK